MRTRAEARWHSTTYSKIAGAKEYLSVTPLLFRPSDLSVERIHKLMAFGQKEGSVPLYMSVPLCILRQMAIESKGDAFDYLAFIGALESENLTKEQMGPLNLRLELLESFLDLAAQQMRNHARSLLNVESGTFTIVDLNDPFKDPATACVLFDICLGLVKQQQESCGLIVALDEAHKYMTTSLAASRFADSLLRTIREQYHNATRIIIATQEPTISEKLLDLCSVSIVHRFSSQAWFAAIQNHLGAASKVGRSAMEQQITFSQIMDLELGESLVCAPSAVLCLGETGVESKLGDQAIKMKTRTRLGLDGGLSVLVSSSRNLATTPSSVTESSPEILSPPTNDLAKITFTRSSTSGCASSLNASINQDMLDSMPKSRDQIHTEDGRVLVPDGSRSFLLLICCSCNNFVLIQFRQHLLPRFTELDHEAIPAGLAYATCMKCQLDRVKETKSASKQFDLAQSKEFRSGRI
nr:hypothetical protein B0A51_13959 [Rachicladosporium sp. CCFEE 5018]